jgi:hypothetical protein
MMAILPPPADPIYYNFPLNLELKNKAAGTDFSVPAFDLGRTPCWRP